MYEIEFTSNGEIVRVISGYNSRSEAMSDIREMDHMIPLSWEWMIKKVEQ